MLLQVERGDREDQLVVSPARAAALLMVMVALGILVALVELVV